MVATSTRTGTITSRLVTGDACAGAVDAWRSCLPDCSLAGCRLRDRCEYFFIGPMFQSKTIVRTITIRLTMQ